MADKELYEMALAAMELRQRVTLDFLEAAKRRAEEHAAKPWYRRKLIESGWLFSRLTRKSC